MKEYIYTWSIENISNSWHTTCDPMVSPKFFASSLQNTAWTLKLYPRGKENSDYLSLKLCREDRQGPENLAVNIEFSCITADTSILNNCFIPEKCTNFGYGGYSEFLEPCFIQRHEVFGRRKVLRCRMWKDHGDANEFGQSFGRTQLIIERIVLVENIDIENSVEKTFRIESKRRNRALMSISVLFCDDVIEVGINPIGEDKMKFSTCELSLVDKRTGRKICERKICFFGRPTKSVWRLPFSHKVLRAECDDSDKSNCEFTTELVYSTGEIKIIEKDCPLRISEFLTNYIGCAPSGYLTDCPSISEDLSKLVADRVLCDVELRAENVSFLVHRIVLCARSPVFLAMLTGAMKEKEDGCIEIEDVSAHTLNKFLGFLYRDSIVLLDWIEAIELYYAADKYKVERLKFLCCCHLLENIDINRVCQLLILADRHHDCELKRKVNNIIWGSDKIVFTSPTWKKFADEQQQLAMETMLSKYEEKENQYPVEMYDESISNHPKIEDDFRSIYQARIASDIVIETASASYPAYKTVLGASSDIFKDMLLNDSRYKSTDFIEIEDLEDDTVSKMLCFLHTDSFEDIQWDTAKKLYHAAVVYKIKRLKFKCLCYLMGNLRVFNACDLLLLAHAHGDERLKSAVEDYICVYDEEIFTSDEWSKLRETNLLLASDTMSAKYKKNQRNCYY